MRAVVTFGILCLASFAGAIAQEQPLQAGQRVRVTAAALGLKKRVATFEAMRTDTLVVTTTATMNYPLSAITQLEAYAGRRGHFWTGFAIGGGLGAVGGAVLGYAAAAIADEYNPQFFAYAAGGALAGGAVLGLLCGGVGALSKSDKWENVPLDGLRVSVVPQRNGIGIGASVAF
jgi:hypothetical protein